MTIRRLLETDDRAGFASGDEALDEFLRHRALAHQRNHASVTYVAVDGQTIVGFCTVVGTVLRRDWLHKRAQRNRPRDLPALLLGRLATHQDHQRRGVGKRLLKFSMELALETQERSGCFGLVVDAKERAIPFYEGFGFVRLSAQTLNTKLVLPCSTMRDMSGS